MLKKKYRLKKNWQFQENFKKGTKKISKRFLCSFKKNNEKKCLFGISVPKKISKKSTKRNLYKRQISEMINSFLKENFCSEKHIHNNLVIITKKTYEEGKFKEKEKELWNLINNFNHIKKWKEKYQ